MGVVRGELRVDDVAVGEQASGAGEIGDIRVVLAGEYGVVVEALLLGQLDLGVPVGALDQAYHEAPRAASAQFGDPVDQRVRALLVGLDGEAEAVPVGELGV